MKNILRSMALLLAFSATANCAFAREVTLEQWLSHGYSTYAVAARGCVGLICLSGKPGDDQLAANGPLAQPSETPIIFTMTSEISDGNTPMLGSFGITMNPPSGADSLVACFPGSDQCGSHPVASHAMLSFNHGIYSFSALDLSTELTGAGGFFRATAINPELTPEPASVLLMAAGLAAIAIRRRGLNS